MGAFVGSVLGDVSRRVGTALSVHPGDPSARLAPHRARAHSEVSGLDGGLGLTLRARRAEAGNYKKVTDTASVKLLVGPGLTSRYDAWKFHVSPERTWTRPVGVGVLAWSSMSENVRVDPELWINPGCASSADRPTRRSSTPSAMLPTAPCTPCAHRFHRRSTQDVPRAARGRRLRRSHGAIR